MIERIYSLQCANCEKYSNFRIRGNEEIIVGVTLPDLSSRTWECPECSKVNNIAYEITEGSKPWPVMVYSTGIKMNWPKASKLKASKYKQYLGDAVYVDFNGQYIVLTAENGIEATNTIYLEGSVFESLKMYSKWLENTLEFERRKKE